MRWHHQWLSFSGDNGIGAPRGRVLHARFPCLIRSCGWHQVSKGKEPNYPAALAGCATVSRPEVNSLVFPHATNSGGRSGEAGFLRASVRWREGERTGEDPARWQVGGAAGCGECVPGPCPTPCTPEQQKPFGSADACGVISAPDGPLAPCHDLVPPAQYFQACLLDACQAQGHPGGLCPAVATYVAACQAAGAQLGEWRRPDFCREYSVMHGPHSGGAGSPCLLFTGLWDKSLLFLGLRHHPASDEPDSSCRTPWHSHTEIHQVTTAVGETWTHPVRNPGSNRLLDTPGQKP